MTFSWVHKSKHLKITTLGQAVEVENRNKLLLPEVIVDFGTKCMMHFPLLFREERMMIFVLFLFQDKNE
jgi:hypothetical protein